MKSGNNYPSGFSSDVVWNCSQYQTTMETVYEFSIMIFQMQTVKWHRQLIPIKMCMNLRVLWHTCYVNLYALLALRSVYVLYLPLLSKLSSLSIQTRARYLVTSLRYITVPLVNFITDELSWSKPPFSFGLKQWCMIIREWVNDEWTLNSWPWILKGKRNWLPFSNLKECLNEIILSFLMAIASSFTHQIILLSSHSHDTKVLYKGVPRHSSFPLS